MSFCTLKLSDSQCKQVLQTILPLLLSIDGDGVLFHCQHRDGIMNGYSEAVRDTELLFLCEEARKAMGLKYSRLYVNESWQEQVQELVEFSEGKIKYDELIKNLALDKK